MPINYADPNAFNPSAQRDAITQALMDVANPPPRTAMPGTQMPFSATQDPRQRLGSQLAPPTAGAVGGMNANPGGMPGQFNPLAAGTPPAAGPLPPSGAPGAGMGMGMPGAIPGAGGPTGGVPPSVMPPTPGAPTAPGPPNIQQLLGNALQQPTPGTQLDPTRGY